MRSETPYAVSSRSKASRTSATFIHTAAKYQITINAATMTTTGPALPARKRRQGETARRRESVSLVIGMPGAQTGANPMGDLDEFRRIANLQRAVFREIAGDHVDDAAGTRRHDHDLGRQKHRLGDRVGDEHHGLA